MSTEREKVLEKIRKLLRMAEGKANENESMTAARQAASLMRQYEIDHKEVMLEEIAEEGAIFSGDDSNIEFHYSDGVPPWINTFVKFLGNLFDCEVAIKAVKVDQERSDFVCKIGFIGIKSDVLVVKWTYRFLVENCQRLADEWYAREIGPRAKGTHVIFGLDSIPVEEATVKLRQEFLHGCGLRICLKIMDMIDERDNERKLSQCTALVVNKQAIIQSTFGKVEYAQGDKDLHQVDTSARMAGYEAAESIDIVTPLEKAEDEDRLEKI